MAMKRWTCVILLLAMVVGVALVGCKRGPKRSKAEAQRQEMEAHKTELLNQVQHGGTAAEQIKAAKELGEIGTLTDAVNMASIYRQLQDESVAAAVKEAIERIETKEGQKVPDMIRQELEQ